MKKVRVGMVGSGFIAELHMHAYRRVFGVDAEVRSVVSRSDHVLDFARRFGIPHTHRDRRGFLLTRRLTSSASARRQPSTPRWSSPACRPAST